MLSVIAVIGLVVVGVWIGFVTFSLHKLYHRYKIFTDGVQKKTLESVLTNIVADLAHAKKDIANLSKRCDTMESNEQFHIQKIGLLRFNPFKDMGGDQSFILSLIDAHGTGVVITALYARSGTRWYAKRVIKGKGFEHDLSEEEQKAVKMANIPIT